MAVRTDTLRRMGWVTLVTLLLVSLIVSVSGVQNYLDVTMQQGRDTTYWRVVRWSAIWWGIWVPLAPVFFELAWRHRPSRTDWLRPLGWLLLGLAASYSLHVAIQVATMYLPVYRDQHDTLAEAVRFHTITSIYQNFFIYGFLVAAANTVHAYQSAQRRALEASRLETALAEARLDALRTQLHPHFLFNTLNGISTLVYRDPVLADRMIHQLSRLLRRALDRSEANEVPLRDEIQFLEEYLAVERLRFGDRLDTRFELDGSTLDLLVPSFVLQPLVENSIKHGMGSNGRSGMIRVAAWRDGDRLCLSVADNGPGLAPGSDALDAGVGLSNLSDRLNRLYGDRSRMTFEDAEPNGLIVTVCVPVRQGSDRLGHRMSAESAPVA